MKKPAGVICILSLMLVLSACGGGEAASLKGDDKNLVDDVMAERIAREEGTIEDSELEDAYLEKNDDRIYSSDLIDATFSDMITEDERQSGVNAGAPEPDKVGDDVTLSSTEGIDVDLTSLNANLVYAEVYNMMIAPENYIGKTIKLDGLYNFYHDEKSDKNYFACIVLDAMECCSAGIEFELSDEYTYPDDYPSGEEIITIEGVFDTYEENGNKYCTLRNAKLL